MIKEFKSPDVELGKVAVKAIKQLSEFFSKPDLTGQDIAISRVSTAVLGAWTRAKQTRATEHATLFAVARTLATDKDQLAKYLAITMPETGVLTDLPNLTDLSEENQELKNRVHLLEEQRNRALLSSAENKGVLVKPGE